jgi:hypothetical protein
MSFALAYQNNKSKARDSKTSTHGNNNAISHHHRFNTFDKDSPDYILHLQRTIGNQAVQMLVRSNNNVRGFDFAKIGILQPKLKISQHADTYEQEADRVAEQVMRMTLPSESVMPQDTTIDRERIDRKCAACEMKEEEEDKKQVSVKLNRKSTSGSSLETNDHVTAKINDIRFSSGNSLDTDTKEFMESRFVYDFSNVRIHTDERATQSANSVNALAYTVGNHIAFAEGQYQPDTSEGRRLLAHELVHTIQQADSHQGVLIQRMQSCPAALGKDDPVPAGWKAYHGNSCWFHCCYRGILEDRRPSPEDPQNECFYDDNGSLVDEGHEYAGCRGTPNEYDSATDWWSHTFKDRGGIWAKGWGAFWSSRWSDINQHFEREGQRMLQCHEVCNSQPWYLRGFCLQGCQGYIPTQ